MLSIVPCHKKVLPLKVISLPNMLKILEKYLLTLNTQSDILAKMILKNVILFNKVQVPHYNYVGDSILGYKSHMGAGSITSNVKSDKKLIVIKNGKEQIETGIKKIGAMLGDEVEIGCGSILNPGSIIGKNTNIYPLSSVRGVVPKNSIYKKQNEIVEKI